MTNALAHIAWRAILGAALALALAGAVLADAKHASASKPLTRNVPTQHAVPMATSTSSARSATRPPERSRYGWPVRPFREQHPVRGFFGDPRISNHGQSRQFHFGVDISAPNGTPVYATLTGRTWIHPLHPNTIAIVGRDGVEFSYWHVIPTVRTGEHVVAYRTVIGHIEAPYGHVHFSEARNGRYLNPLRPGAMGPFADDTRPEILTVIAEPSGRQLHSSRIRGTFDLVTEVRDGTPIAVPRPWHGLPVMPALVRWRLVGARGGRSQAGERWWTSA
jgi:hypothetical protein